MADDVLLNSGSGGDTIGADQIATVKYQRVKLIFGSDGVNKGDVEVGNPLPVQIATVTGFAVVATTTNIYGNIASVQSIAGSVTALTLFSTLSSRAGCSIWNDSASRLYVKYGQNLSTTLYSFKVAPYGYWEMGSNGFGGIVTGVWEVATGSAFTTQWSY